MFHYVYVLENKEGRLYTGYTTNLKERVQEHNRGLSFSTKPYRPWHFIYGEVFLNRKDAQRRERYLKTNQGSRLLQRMLKAYFHKTRGRKTQSSFY